MLLKCKQAMQLATIMFVEATELSKIVSSPHFVLAQQHFCYYCSIQLRQSSNLKEQC
jgi:hypothetical protein